MIRELLDAGLLHPDVRTVSGDGLARYTREPALANDMLIWRPAPAQSLDENVLRPASGPFSPDGGLKILRSNLGRAVIKVSAVKVAHRIVEAKAIVFDDQDEVLASFKRCELHCDFIAVLCFQGPRANGMPELHKLTPALGSLQDEGFNVALVTDGRMSGASGKVPAAIHVTPECLAGSPLALARTGDLMRLDAEAGTLEAKVAVDEWRQRRPAILNLAAHDRGMGRELFAAARSNALSAEAGAMTFLGGAPINTNAPAAQLAEASVA